MAVEQAGVEADQRRKKLVPGKLVAGHIPGTAEVVGVQSADYSLLDTEYRTAVVAEVPAAAEHHDQPVEGTVGTPNLLVSELPYMGAVVAELLGVSCGGGGSNAVRCS